MRSLNGINEIFWLVSGIIFASFALIIWRFYGKKSPSPRRDLQERRKRSEAFLIIGLIISSVLDPASKARIENVDKMKKRKVEPGKENA